MGISTNLFQMAEWDWSSSSESSSSEDEWEKEHKQVPRYKRGGKWVRTGGDDIPELAVRAGTSSDGGPLYVGRAEHEGGLFPGKVNPEHDCSTSRMVEKRLPRNTTTSLWLHATAT